LILNSELSVQRNFVQLLELLLQGCGWIFAAPLGFNRFSNSIPLLGLELFFDLPLALD
jgi:hypothetical protein